MQPSDKQFNPDNLDEWMSAHIDGMLDAASAAQLDAYLAENPDAQAEFNALRSVVDALAALPPADAPADLLDNVMAHVTSAPAETTKERDEAPLTRPAYSMMPWIRRAAGIAAVLLVVRVGYHEWGQQQEPRSIDNVTPTEEAVHASERRLDEISEPIMPEAGDAAAKSAASAAPAHRSMPRPAAAAADFRSTLEAASPETAPEEREASDLGAEAKSKGVSELDYRLGGALAPAGKSNAKALDLLYEAPADDVAKLHEDRDAYFSTADRENAAPTIVEEDKQRHHDQLKSGVARDIAPPQPSAGPEKPTGRMALSAEVGKKDQIRDERPAPADINGGGFKGIDADSNARLEQPFQNATDSKASYAQARENAQDDNATMLRRITKDADAIPVRLRGSIVDVDAVIADFQTPRPGDNGDRQKAPASGITSDYAEVDEMTVSNAKGRSDTHAMLRVVHLEAKRYAEFIKALSAVGTLIKEPEALQQKDGWFFSKRSPKRITIYLLIDPPAPDATAGE
ncbi:MAG: hypothetical protein OSB41_05955 [Kiritimatiellae bacterium]|nr:hypothetical protein [Kiritimatiellia bacterium]